MKIYKNKSNLLTAWMHVANAMDIIKSLYLDNCEDANEDAYYELLKSINNWNSKISRM